jgi:hypothetical protein
VKVFFFNKIKRRETVMKILMGCLVIFSLVLGGCTKNDDNNSMSKEEAASKAKTDNTTDFCEIMGWYGDGVCDTFCLNPDPDCGAEEGCYIGGCSGQICSDTDGVISTCEWWEYYECYAMATCGLSSSGNCSWSGSEFVDCLYEHDACPYFDLPPEWWCDGGQLVDQDPDDIGCPRPPACERKEGATCGGEYDFVCDEGFTCIGGVCGADEPEPGCYVGGCSGQICSDTEGVMSTCEWWEYYACYSLATCGLLPSGNCGWSGSEFVDCLYSYSACPYYDQPPEWWCDGGVLVDQDPDDVGCPRPPACKRGEGATCGGEHGFMCDEEFTCVGGVCSSDEPEPGCYIGGCSGEICSDTEDVMSDCMSLEYYECYTMATCGISPKGNCVWTGAEDFIECLGIHSVCPYYDQPPTWWCDGGVVVDQDPDDLGCPRPPACERKEGATCGGEHQFECDEGFVCIGEICEAGV